IFQPLQMGQILRGYIKTIRPDGKIDLSLQKNGYRNQVPDASDILSKKIKENANFLPLTDDSAPELIYEMLGMSKKTFKKALGSLYKQRLVTIETDGIRLIGQ
ncbi:MAG: GntR family transcriptional regulator, partial [Saprospiraceae bacterium]|nr:GntR family transcriptional regulator [Saprospiraceae bacterium]